MSFSCGRCHDSKQPLVSFDQVLGVCCPHFSVVKLKLRIEVGRKEEVKARHATQKKRKARWKTREGERACFPRSLPRQTPKKIAAPLWGRDRPFFFSSSFFPSLSRSMSSETCTQSCSFRTSTDERVV